jgi:hypothetical protein
MRTPDRGGPSTLPKRGLEGQRVKLRDAAAGLEACTVSSAGPVSAPEVAEALARLGAAWADHVEFTESDDGLFHELLAESFEVAAEVDHLRRDHRVIGAALLRAGDSMQSAPGAATEQDLAAIANLLRLVSQHRRRGADVLYRVYHVDVAAGD